MSRLELSDSGMQIAKKMAEGIPGAVTVLVGLLTKNEAIDPDSAFGPLGAIMTLDTCGIYGSRIWMLYKDVCGQDIVKTIGLLRAVQLGLLDEASLHAAIDNYGRGIDVDKCLTLVRAELPDFGKAAS